MILYSITRYRYGYLYTLRPAALDIFCSLVTKSHKKTPPGRPTMTRKERPHLVTAAWKSVGDVYKGLAKAISSALSS